MVELRDLRLADVMSPLGDLLRVDSTVQQAADYLLEKRFSGAPLVDAEGKLVGLVSTSDLLRFVIGEPEARRQASLSEAGLTERQAESCEAQVPVVEACKRIVRARGHRMIVVDGEKPVGIFTVADAVRVIAALDEMQGG